MAEDLKVGESLEKNKITTNKKKYEGEKPWWEIVESTINESTYHRNEDILS